MFTTLNAQRLFTMFVFSLKQIFELKKSIIRFCVLLLRNLLLKVTCDSLNQSLVTKNSYLINKYAKIKSNVINLENITRNKVVWYLIPTY